ncbi:hypothetical protein Hanom_Chr01g00090971 [Helianthus anomalus]
MLYCSINSPPNYPLHSSTNSLIFFNFSDLFNPLKVLDRFV